MKRILILGSAGMAGHTIYKYLSSLDKYEILTTARNDKYISPNFIIDIERELIRLKAIIYIHRPDIIINCIGILVKEANDNPLKAIYVNSYFPHWLEETTKNIKTKIIHLSTDCVFDGKKINGGYNESNVPNETNWYGKSKSWGEIINDKDLTIRLSIIGDELKPNGTGLFHWFMKQKGTIKGFTKAYWNGILTLELAKQLEKIIDSKYDLRGLYQLVPDFKIAKYDLLHLIQKIFNKNDVVMLQNNDFIQDKTLINNRKDEYDPKIPSYEQQLIEMKLFLRS